MRNDERRTTDKGPEPGADFTAKNAKRKMRHERHETLKQSGFPAVILPVATRMSLLQSRSGCNCYSDFRPESICSACMMNRCARLMARAASSSDCVGWIS